MRVSRFTVAAYYFNDRRVLITAAALMEGRGYNSFRNPPDLRARVRASGLRGWKDINRVLCAVGLAVCAT